MTKGDIVWSSEDGDLRGKKSKGSDAPVNESDIEIHLRRVTTGKGRAVIELTNLPNNKNWCKKLAKGLKKSLAVGGAYKDNKIEVHGEKLDMVKDHLKNIDLKFKQIGG
tara:strand:+ start:17689 stop:18015 length:327 start_codon:yes stop_codon:yes gene_type:complete